MNKKLMKRNLRYSEKVATQSGALKPQNISI